MQLPLMSPDDLIQLPADFLTVTAWTGGLAREPTTCRFFVCLNRIIFPGDVASVLADGHTAWLGSSRRRVKRSPL